MPDLLIIRHAAWLDFIGSYRISVDNMDVGSIGRGAAVKLWVLPGRHAIQLRIAWFRSRRLDIFVNAEGAGVVECGSNLIVAITSIVLVAVTPLWVLFHFLVRERYIWIRCVASEDGSMNSRRAQDLLMTL